MVNFIDTLKGILNTDPLVKDSQLDIRNIIKLNNTGGNIQDPSARPTTGIGSGSTSPEVVLPKAPAFKYYDPVSNWLNNSNLTEEAKDDLWSRHQRWMEMFDDDRRAEVRQKLKTSDDYLDGYINALMEEAYREEGERRSRHRMDEYLKDYMKSSFSRGIERSR